MHAQTVIRPLLSASGFAAWFCFSFAVVGELVQQGHIDRGCEVGVVPQYVCDVQGAGLDYLHSLGS